MHQTGEAFNIKIMTTAAESRWENGICKWLNSVIGDRVSHADTSWDIDVALSWTVSNNKRIAMLCQIFSGFSSNRMGFGFHLVVPDVI